MTELSKWFTHDGNDNVTAKDLIKHFRSENLEVPKDAVAFYEKYNGVSISDFDYAFFLDVPKDFETKEELFFYGFLDVESIINDDKEFRNYSYPKNMILLTDTQPGYIILSLDPLSHGQVLFCESDVVDEQMEGYSTVACVLEDFDYPNKPLPKIMFKIADSFTEFLEKIEVKEY